MSHNTLETTAALTRAQRLDAVRIRLAEDQDGILESLMQEYDLSALDVVGCLPQACWQQASGEHYLEVLEDIAEWGDMTTIVHNPGVILEFKGPFPRGRQGHGFYNLQNSHGLCGHLTPEQCANIVFMRRPFMGSATASLQFFDAHGNTMFKVYLGRDESRQLKADQLERFDALAKRLAASCEVSA